MPLQGDVATFSVADLFDWLARRRATGTLSLSRGLTVRWFQIRDGEIVLASSSEQELLLGRLLVERGLLDESALAEVLTARRGGAARLGRRLAKAGLVAAPELAAVLHEKVRRLLLDALSWQDGRFTFTPGESKRTRAALPVSVDLSAFRRESETATPAVLAVAEEDVVAESDMAPPAPWPWPATPRA